MKLIEGSFPIHFCFSTFWPDTFALRPVLSKSLGSWKVTIQSKALRRSTASGVNFTNILCSAFTCTDLKSAKKIDNLTLFLRFWDLCMKKLLVENLWNWHQVFGLPRDQRNDRIVQVKKGYKWMTSQSDLTVWRHSLYLWRNKGSKILIICDNKF